MIRSSEYYKLCLCTFCFLFLSTRAQDPHPAFKQYDVEDGLCSSTIYHVKQDSKGYIWFAGDNGVSRFNGYEFENFSMEEGLPDNTVFELYEDQQGRMWFIPLSNKLSYYENGKIHPYKYNDVIERIKGQPVKSSFCVTDSGSIFLGLFEYGICEITARGELLMHFDRGPAKKGYLAIEPVANHLVYANNNMSKNRNVFEFKTKSLNDTLIIETDHYTESSSITLLKNNSIVFSQNRKLYIIDGSKSVTVHVFSERIVNAYEDKSGNLWVCTFLGGVYYFPKGDFSRATCYLKGLFTTSVIEDQEGGIWITTSGNSVYYAPSRHTLTYDKLSGLMDDRINCLATDKDGVIFGMQHPAIQKISTSGNIITYPYKDGNTNISGIYCNQSVPEIIYCGNKLRYVLKNDVLEKYTEGEFYKLIPDGDDSYWGVNSHGLFRIIDHKVYPRNKKLSRINALVKKNSNRLLLGDPYGLWEYDISKDVFISIGKEHPLLQKRILDMVYTPDSALLIATKGAGILLYKDNEVKQLQKSDGLSSNNIYKIQQMGSTLWLGTDKGLSQIFYNGKDFDRHHIRIYTSSNGLASNKINDICLFDDKLWLATDKGLSFLDPNMPIGHSGDLPLYISQIVVNDNIRTIRDHYDLRYFENNIKIRFIALSYRNSGKLQYRYKMTGLNLHWSYTQEREIQYTTLPPGEYTFIVSVLNADGKWGKDVPIGFTVSIPFWKTWWFLVLSVTLTGGVLFYIISYRISIKHRKKSKEEQVNRVLLQLKLKALRAQMNPHFIFNVMNSIQHFVLFNDNNAAHRYLSKFSRLIRVILNNSEKNMIPLAEEIKALKLYLELENMRFERHFEYNIMIDEHIDVHITEIPSMLIQPYVENAVKHGILHAINTGKIEIEIVKHHHFLKCSIEDNGVGMEASFENKNAEYRSFGTSITKERLMIISELYNNKLKENVINLYDEKGKAAGTKVEIFIPYHINKATGIS